MPSHELHLAEDMADFRPGAPDALNHTKRDVEINSNIGRSLAESKGLVDDSFLRILQVMLS